MLNKFLKISFILMFSLGLIFQSNVVFSMNLIENDEKLSASLSEALKYVKGTKASKLVCGWIGELYSKLPSIRRNPSLNSLLRTTRAALPSSIALPSIRSRQDLERQLIIKSAQLFDRLRPYINQIMPHLAINRLGMDTIRNNQYAKVATLFVVYHIITGGTWVPGIFSTLPCMGIAGFYLSNAPWARHVRNGEIIELLADRLPPAQRARLIAGDYQGLIEGGLRGVRRATNTALIEEGIQDFRDLIGPAGPLRAATVEARTLLEDEWVGLFNRWFHIDRLTGAWANTMDAANLILRACANSLDAMAATLRVAVEKPKKAIATVAIGTALTVAAAKGVPFLFRVIEDKYFRPVLIKEASWDKKTSVWQKLKNLFVKLSKIRTMIFTQDVEARLNNIVEAIINIAAKMKRGFKNVRLRNLFLFGKPGTGKTMFAKVAADRAKLPWVMITGASFEQFSEGDAIRAMNELFRYLKKKFPNGVIVIFDEFDSFAMPREKMDPNSKSYKILNNFLAWTGDRDDRKDDGRLDFNIMFIFCANHKNFDSAMIRRIQDYVELPLPDLDTREKVLMLYRDEVLRDKRNGLDYLQSVMMNFGDTKVREVARLTEGLSNGDLSELINIMKTDSDITADGLLTSKIVDNATKNMMEKQHALSADNK